MRAEEADLGATALPGCELGDGALGRHIGGVVEHSRVLAHDLKNSRGPVLADRGGMHDRCAVQEHHDPHRWLPGWSARAPGLPGLRGVIARARVVLVAGAIAQIGGEVTAILVLQIRPLPIAAADDSPARARAAPAFHLLIGIVEEGVVGREFLAADDIAHRDEDHVARETYVRLAGVIDEQHDWLVLVVLQRDEMEAVGDLDLGVPQPRGQGVQGGGVNDVPALDRDDLARRYRSRREKPAPLNVAGLPLGGLSCDVAGDDHGSAAPRRGTLAPARGEDQRLTRPRAERAGACRTAPRPHGRCGRNVLVTNDSHRTPSNAPASTSLG